MAIDSITIGKTFKMDNVYYDSNKATLRGSSKKELNKLYDLLMAYPTMVVELASHTDSRGSMGHNERLSSYRAISCYEYLVGKGIESERIVPKGYGEMILTNRCADGVKCSGSEHQRNRRTEFTVLSFEGQDCPSGIIEEVSAR